jgi:hypothetical protein
MPDEFDKITGDFHLDLDTQAEINRAAAIHAYYFWRLVNEHGIPHHIAQEFTGTFIQAAVVDPED